MKQWRFWYGKGKVLWKKEGRYWAVALLCSVCLWTVCLITSGYAAQIQSGISAKVVRFHVLANSDRTEDQALKLAVRDRILAEFGEKLESCTSKEETLQVLQNSKEEIAVIATKEVVRQGRQDAVRVSVVREDFPQKQYGDLVFPAGVYDALRVEIGAAQGQNWWCVMFPSLCFVDITSGVVDDDAKENLESNLDEESYDIISDNDNFAINFKFKLIEFFAESGLFTAKN